MTKKLFVVLVVITTMLIGLSVFAADKKPRTLDVAEYTAPPPLYPGGGERMAIDKTIPADRLDIQLVPSAALEWQMVPGGTPQVPLNPKQDTCLVEMHSGAAYWIRGWYGGDEMIKEYADPENSNVPCEMPVYPFQVTKLYMHIQDTTSNSFDVVGYFDIQKADLSDPSCPRPGPVIWQSPLLTWSIPNGGHWKLTYSPAVPVCVDGPYFISFYFEGPTTYELGPITDATPDPCRSYNDWGTGWYDLVVDIGFPGNLLLYSAGLSYGDAQNLCPAAPECEYLWWHDGVSWWSYTGYEAGAVWFTSPKTGYIARARINHEIAGSPAGCWYFLWDGDAMTGPGNKIDSIYVPSTDLANGWVEVDWTASNITVEVGDLIFFGFEPGPVVPPDTLRWLSDYNGNGIETHSWLQSGGVWYDEYTAWGDYAEYMMELEICGEAPCEEPLEVMWGGMTGGYVWRTPSDYGHLFVVQRFDFPVDHGGRLDQFEVSFYQTYDAGSSDPDMYVWLSDGVVPLDNNPPGAAMASYHMLHGDIAWFPNTNIVQTWEDGLVFGPGESFHVGFGHAFDPGDTLVGLSDTGPGSGERSCQWSVPDLAWETILDGYGVDVDLLINAYICPHEPEDSTFALRCTPSLNYATPGDPPVDLYEIDVVSVIGYALPVTLSLLSVTPAEPGIHVTFTPNGDPAPYTSTVGVFVDPPVVYGDYVLEFQGVGADGQIRTCDVTLTVQPPYDEGHVNFYHGFQRVSNFGAVANGNTTGNFEWYGADPLYDGTIISFAPVGPWEDWDQHMALDLYDCEHVGFIPTQHMTITDIAGCPGTAYEELYGEMSYSEFYTEEDVISCEWDSLFIIGLRDVECTDFSIKIKIYYNPTATPIPEMYAGIFEDWDVLGDDWGEMDTVHNMLYQYDPADPNIVFGIMSVPFYDQFCHTMKFIHNPTEVYPDGDSSINCGNDPGPAYLARLMMQPGYRDMGYWTPDPDDHSVLTVSPPFSLNPDEKHIEIWIDFGRNLGDGMTWEQWRKKILRYAGFYRGDVNASDTLDLPSLDVSDLVYLINYLYRGGPAPLPFADQGDVNAKGPYGVGPCDNLHLTCPKENVDLADLVYLINFIYKGGPAPVDRVRFIEQCWTRPSLFLNPLWM